MADFTHQIITSRSEFHRALHGALAHAASVGCRELFISDTDFSDWPLGQRDVIDSLNLWVNSHHKLVVLARSFDELMRRHPRWLAWRRQWGHVVECRVFAEAGPGEVPSLLLLSGVAVLRLHDPVHYRGNVSTSLDDVQQVREELDVILQRSAAALPVTTVGL